MMISIPKTAVIPAAGLGMRLRPATLAIPKEMFPIGRFPAIEWIIADAVRSGCENIIIITRQGKEIIEDYISKHRSEISKYCEIKFILQPEPIGLGPAVTLVDDYIREDRFALLLPDNMIDAEKQPLNCLVTHSAGKTSCIISVMESYNVLASRKSILGSAEIHKDYFKLTGIKHSESESADYSPSNLLEIGRSVLSRDFIDAAKKLQKDQISDEITGGMVLNRLIAEGVEVNALKVAGKCFDISTLEGYIAAWQHFGTSEPLWQ